MSTTTPQKFEFQAEIKQLLDIVIHSLYTEKEIFVRELVSNASDALEKLRHTQLTEKDVFGDQPLEINVTTDDKAKTITIQDFGIGMTRAELVENLGTIAHSGSKAFLKSLAEGDQKNTNLIGQFGVGFYSAFMVADRIEVVSRRAGGATTFLWSSDGAGGFSVGPAPAPLAATVTRGTAVILHLKSDAKSFLEEHEIERIVRTYSDHILFPIELVDGGGKARQINSASALWQRSPKDVTDEQYNSPVSP